jgi:hypothetical protein
LLSTGALLTLLVYAPVVRVQLFLAVEVHATGITPEFVAFHHPLHTSLAVTIIDPSRGDREPHAELPLAGSSFY